MDSNKKTYYDVLEISPAASDEIIRSAYKALARKYHPDVSSVSAEEANRKMVEINEAYDVLSDQEKRASYDLTLRNQRTYDDTGVADKSTESTAQRTNRDNASVTSNKNMASNTTSSKPGCLSRIFTFFIVVIAIVVFMARGCSRTAENAQEKSSVKVSDHSQTETTSTIETNDSKNENDDSSFIVTHPMDIEWDNAANSYLESASSETDYEEKLGDFMAALYLQCMEYAFKYGIYEECGRKNFDKLPSTKKQEAEISNTVNLMTETFGEEVVAEVYYVIANDCVDWIDERKSDIVASLGKALNLKNADIDDLWELYLSANGGVEAFFPE